VVDTSLFDLGFQARLLESFDDIDAYMDGILVNSENFGALCTLLPSIRSSVSVVYIDPPYNTGKDGFLYKDDFHRHSTWLTFMRDRLVLGRQLLSEDGLLFVSINDDEL